MIVAGVFLPILSVVYTFPRRCSFPLLIYEVFIPSGYPLNDRGGRLQGDFGCPILNDSSYGFWTNRIRTEYMTTESGLAKDYRPRYGLASAQREQDIDTLISLVLFSIYALVPVML